jgi:hypothetical protein
VLSKMQLINVSVTPFSCATSCAPLEISVVPFALTVKSAVPPLWEMLALVGLIEIELMTMNTVAVAEELRACALAPIPAVPGATPVRTPVFASMDCRGIA